jgi:putative sterol carrier protein
MSDETPTPSEVASPPEVVKKKKKKKSKRLLGFPGVINAQLSPLNDIQFFKDTYGADNFDILLIATEDRRAAIVHIADGTVKVEQVKVKSEEFAAAKKRIKTRITTDTETFLKFGMGTVKPIPAILSGKLKIKNTLKVLHFKKYFGVIRHHKQQLKAAAAAAKPTE